MAARIHAPPPRRRRTAQASSLITPTTLQRVNPSNTKPVAIAWSPSGTYLAVATQHGPIYLFYVLTAKRDVIRPNPIRTFRAHAADVLHMSFSNSDFLLSASMDRSVRLWHADVNLCLRNFLHSDMVTTVAFHPSDHNFVLSAGCDGVVRLWRLPDHACVGHADVGAVVTVAQFTSDGTRAFVGTYDGRVLVLEITDLMERASRNITSSPINVNTSRSVNTQAPYPLSTNSVVAAETIAIEKTVSVRQRRARRKSPGPKVGTMCVRTSQKDTVVVGSDARVHVFAKDGEVVNRMKASLRKEGTVPLGCSSSPDGRYVLHDAIGGALRVLDLQAQQKVESHKRREKEIPVGVENLPVVSNGNVSCAAFASTAVLDNMRPGGDSSGRYLLAVGADDGTVWIVETCRPR